MTAREEVLAYALSFADVYTERPFRDQNWQLVRIGYDPVHKIAHKVSGTAQRTAGKTAEPEMMRKLP